MKKGNKIRLLIGLLAFFSMHFLYAKQALLTLPSCKPQSSNYAGCNLVLTTGGTPGTITIQNNSNIIAKNIAATLPASWTDVTQNASACVSLAPGASCQLIFTPGATAHAQETIFVKGSNTTTVSYTMSVVLGSYTVGGAVSGLTGTVGLQNNGSDTLSISVDGTFTFPTPLTQGSSYAVTVSSQPLGQTCTVANGTGNISSNVTNVAVTCVTNTYTVGGTISGLVGTVSLQNNSGDTLTTSTAGGFTFSTALVQGSPYNVTVSAQPAGQTCTVANGMGTIGTSNVTDVVVTCSVNAYTVGGNVSGLTGGTVTLLNNGTDSLPVSVNGPFTFSTSIAQGSPYAVTVQTQPVGQVCSVSNGTGNMGSANVTNVVITCSASSFTVGGTVSGLTGTVTLLNNGANSLPVSANGPFTFSTSVASGSPYAVTVQTQPAGQFCTVGNGTGTIGGSNVTNVVVNCTSGTASLSFSETGTIPVNGGTNTFTINNTGTTYSATNVSITLPSGWTAVTENASGCAVIAPGSSCNIVFSSTAPYVAQGNIQVVGDNVTFASDSYIALAFTMSGYLVWDVPTLSTAQVIDSLNSALPWSPSATTTGATDLVNGVSNTQTIVTAIGASSTYAAGFCNQSTVGGASVGDWYLPAVCQLGTSGKPAGCPTGLANIQTNLATLGFLGASGILAWSSTEYSNPLYAWNVGLTPSGSDAQNIVAKTNSWPFFCARVLTYP